MLKHVYRVIILVAIFVGAIYYFSKDIKEVVFEVDNTIIMEDATFPLVTIKTNDRVVNMLHGYSSNMSANKLREAVTPIGTDQTFEVLFKNDKIKVKKLNYELREIAANKLMESSSVSVFENSGEYKSAKIKLNATLVPGKEYAVKVALINSKSQKLYYYHRIKVYENTHLQENIDFVMQFHQAILNKDTAQEMQVYLSPPSKSSKTPTLSFVSMETSKMDMISWADFRPKVISEVVPTIKEIFSSMASIELSYYVESGAGEPSEKYHVVEFYRVRYGTDRMHLYNYERRMESVFNMDLADVQKSQLKLGVTNDTQIPYMPGVDGNKMTFVRDGSLWLYDFINNEVTRVFSFQQKQPDYIRDHYDQHNVRVIDMDVEGNIDFMVYGYMNRGQYEGHVGVLLYRFIKAENRIVERLYIPVEDSYQILKENIGELSYINLNDVFYFNIYNTIYAYDLITGHLSEIATKVDHNQVVILPGGNCIAWQETSDLRNSKKINIMNLDSETIQTITASQGYNIRLLDKIDNNIVYGYIKNDDIVTRVDGSIVAPITTVEIASADKKVLKTYSEPGYYVTEVAVKDNILELQRIKKAENNAYVSAASDFIMNQVKTGSPLLGISARTRQEGLIEYYMTFPKSFTMNKKPKVITTVNTVINQDPTLRLPDDSLQNVYYYPYISGGIEGSYLNAAEAIAKARDRVGVVWSSQNQLVWERGVQAIIGEHTISRFDSMNWSVSNDKTIDTCIKLILEYQGIQRTVEELKISQNSAFDVFKEYSKYTPVRLTGTNLIDALYYVSMDRPLLALKDNGQALIIYGFDLQNIKVIDPTKGSVMRMGINDAKQIFEAGGNVFISYLEQ